MNSDDIIVHGNKEVSSKPSQNSDVSNTNMMDDDEIALPPPLKNSVSDSTTTPPKSVGITVKKLLGRLHNRKYSIDEDIDNIPRLVHRNAPFKQSRQEIAVVNKSHYKLLKVQRLLSQDWYHIFLRQNTLVTIIALLSIWTLVVIIFALVYMGIDAENPMLECGLGSSGNPIQFGSAFAFSLETCTTVGYGLPNGTNSFFESECSNLQVAIYFQMVFSMMFNAFLFAFLFAQLARCNQRGAQVLFANKAIVERKNGKWMMHVRVYDYDSSQPVVEAHVRMYCVSWLDYAKQSRDMIQPHLLHAMRILHPDDDRGAMLYTSVPLNITHQIDVFSPLYPKDYREQTNRMDDGGLKLREIDQYINNTGIACPACGEVFGCHSHLKKHINYNSLVENMEPSFPIVGSHRDPDLIEHLLQEPKELTESELREHLRDKEIMVVVEGIEPAVSGTFQALQSYKIDDIHFGGRYAPCMSQEGGKIYVDVDKFHEIIPPSDESIRNFNEYKLANTF